MTYPYLPETEVESTITAAIMHTASSLRTSGRLTGAGLKLMLGIVDEYRHPTRFYHGLRHLAHGFAELHRYEAHLVDSAVTHFAWLCHDRVYAAGSPVNEHWSAELARADAIKVGFTAGDANAIAEMIEATKQHQIEPDFCGHRSDLELLLDIDLMALSFDHDVFVADGELIRAEYGTLLSDADWETERATFAHSRLAGSIYHTELFRDRERQAKDNLQWATTQVAA